MFGSQWVFRDPQVIILISSTFHVSRFFTYLNQKNLFVQGDSDL